MRTQSLKLLLAILGIACAGTNDAVQSAENSSPATPTVLDSVFARSESTFRAIQRQDDWPETFDAAVVVIRDSTGTIRAVEEQPRSESGDWTLSHVHRFDTAGRTERYESVGRYFSACAGITEATLRIEFDTLFVPRRLTRTLRDDAGAERSPQDCGHAYEFFDGEPAATLADLKRLRRVPPALR